MAGRVNLEKKRIYSFRSRLIALLFAGALLPVTLLGLVSFNSISSLVRTRLDESIQKNLSQINISSERIVDNMVSTSQLLAFDADISMRISEFFTGEGLFNRVFAKDVLVKQIDLIDITNNKGTIAFYEPATGAVVCDQSLKADFLTYKPRHLAGINWITLSGPHTTEILNSGYLVFSTLGKLGNDPDSNVYIYMESDFRQVQRVMENKTYGMPIAHIILDDTGTICYSEMDGEFPLEAVFSDSVKHRERDYAVYTEKNKYGFTICAIVERDIINREINSWVRDFLLILLLTLLLSIGLGFVVWRIVNKPLVNFSRELSLMTSSDAYIPGSKAGAREFDVFLTQFQRLRQQVWELLEVTRQDARRAASWEVEKLLYQINPHFLHNTLDIIRWKARLNGQTDIEKMATSLNRLLHYNLGKGNDATLAEELRAVSDYVYLQKNRYGFQYAEQIDIADERNLHLLIPRFVLQPLVENAILHGIDKENGTITLSAREAEGAILITIQDDGAGMSEDKLTQLQEKSSTEFAETSFGIGISYVVHMLRNRFGNEAAIDIRSTQGKGTRVSLRIPIQLGEDR